jgi:endonuclease G
MVDNSSVLEICKPLAHAIDFFCFRGRPRNLDQQRPVSVIVNHGYVVGFSTERLQPVWAAYQVSAARRDVDYERPHLFYDDPRLPETLRIGAGGFGKVGGRAYDRGHLVPNFAINTQFGRLAQSETFFMSNISPQDAKTNRGVWARLEKLIINQFAPAWEHIWVMTGPVFGDEPSSLQRSGGRLVPVPEGHFMILVDPQKYPHHQPKNVNFLALYVPSTSGYRDPGDELVTTVEWIEEATKLRFFPELSAAEKKIVAERTSTTMWAYRDLPEKPHVD